MDILSIFSRRNRKHVAAALRHDDFPESLRNQICFLLGDAFPDVDPSYFRAASRGTLREQYFPRVAEYLRRELGRLRLAEARTSYGELCRFVAKASPEEVLDAIEVTLHVLSEVEGDPHHDYLFANEVLYTTEQLSEKFSQRFEEHGVGFRVAAGRVLRIDSEVLHVNATQPAVRLLSAPGFAGPNDEFLSANDHYRHRRYKECLADCLKAFESTMKTICKRRGWIHEERATAKDLIHLVLSRDLVPSMHETQLIAVRQQLESGIPTLRNRLAGHGQGSSISEVAAHVARYQLNLTATTILFLMEAEANG